jgi:hypothetical protein
LGLIVLSIFFSVPSHGISDEPTFAVDISHWSGEITASEVACWWDSGVRHVIVGTLIPEITVQQLETAVNGGMTVDAYVMLYWDYNIPGQVQDALDTIQGFPVGRLWLDAEQPLGNWSASQVIQKIQQAVDACGAFPTGIYTRKVWWRDNLGNTSAFSGLPLWYAYYDGNGDFDDWYDPLYWYEGPFGGWTDPTGKQYDSDWTAPDLCGVNVDYNIMYVDTVAGSFNGEVGKVTVNQSSPTQWHKVTLINTYANPVVILQPPSHNGGDPSTMRLRHITANSFEFQIDEWDYRDGTHIMETMSYLVMETGVFNLDDGTRVEVGQAQVKHNFTAITFNQPFATAPVVISQAQTYNDTSAVVTRQRNVSVIGFEVKLQEQEANDQAHSYETVGYIAIESAFGLSGDMAFEAQMTPDTVTHNWYSIEFLQSYSDPVFIAGVHSYDGGDPVALRYKGLAASSVQVFMEEEKSADSETGHTTEIAGYFVFDHPGSFNDVDTSSVPTGLNPDNGQTITTNSVTLSCNPISGASLYEFEIGYWGGSAWQYYYTYTSSINSQTFWPVFDDTAYKWRVRVEDVYGWSAWSTYAEFNFGNVGGNLPPPAPDGLSPDNGQTLTTSSVTLSCNAITGATQYQFEIKYWNGSDWQHYYTYSSSTNAQTFWPVYDDAIYQWRVRAENAQGWGAWSAYAEFNFGDVGGRFPPSAPMGLSPDNGQALTTNSVTLSCDAISGATQYQFEIDYWNGSAWQYYYIYTSGTDSQTFWPSVHNMNYRWRVRAQNDYDWGAWSAYADFYFD